MTVASFLFFLAVFIAVGISSYRLAKPTSADYLLAGRTVKPWLTGLSAVATNNSGYMFIGVIGYTYSGGMAGTWLMVGWLLGDWIASNFVHRRLRTASGDRDENTFPGIIANWHGEEFKRLRQVGGLLSIAFLGSYAAAQLNAGSKALQALFDWAPWAGAVIGACIVLAYCLAGGIRASIWTDAAQSFVMIIAMTLLLVVAVHHLGGPGAAWDELQAVGGGFMDPIPGGFILGDPWGPLLFVLGWTFAGASVVGQPHVMVRFMALEDVGGMTRARAWYYAFFVFFYLAANAVGLLSRVLLPAEGFDPELALPTIAMELLHPVFVGLILAGVFAATMSTADSLVLSCSASVTDDIVRGGHRNVWIVKGGTLAVTLIALAIAVTGPDSVFVLVIYSWAGLAAAFGPLLVVLALGGRPRQGLSLIMMVVGVTVVVLWRQVPVLADYYEGMGGILAGFAVYGIGRALGFADSHAGDASRIDAAGEGGPLADVSR